MRVLLCLIMAAITLNMSAFAGEVWILDLDSSPVVVNEDGSTEPFEYPPAEVPAADPVEEEPVVEEPAVEEPVTDPVVDSVEDSPVEDPAIEEPASDIVEEVTPEESEEEEVILMGVLDETDSSIMPYTISELNEVDSEIPSDPENQTMKDVVVMVLGEYSPRTQTVTQYLSDGSSESYVEIVPGVAGMDWEWISGAVLFALVLFSFFKFVGVLLRNG